MLLLITFVLIAIVFSFLCSVAEAVILSVSTSYIVALEKNGRRAAGYLRELKAEINNPLAVILTLNTIAHTVGAAGAGAQAAKVFGNVYLGLFSAVLTLLILVFSEIIPKALGAYYWRALAPLTAYVLRFMVRALYPFVWLSNFLTRGFVHEAGITGFSREEFSAMAELGEKEGQLAENESLVLRNLFKLHELRVQQVMTPRTVIVALDEKLNVREGVAEVGDRGFSRILIFSEPEKITGFVLRADMLVAYTEGEYSKPLETLKRELHVVLDRSSLLAAFQLLIERDAHILLVVDEYGVTKGILTLEDVLETLLGVEITDESDSITDRQALAKRYGRLRRKHLGLDLAEDMAEDKDVDVQSIEESGATEKGFLEKRND